MASFSMAQAPSAAMTTTFESTYSLLMLAIK